MMKLVSQLLIVVLYHNFIFEIEINLNEFLLVKINLSYHNLLNEVIKHSFFSVRCYQTREREKEQKRIFQVFVV